MWDPFHVLLFLVLYTEQQKKRILFIFGIVYKLWFKYWSNDMKGITYVLNMWIIKCITNGWLIRIMIIKGCNSGCNKITHNKSDFWDGVCLKPLNGFEWKSLCVIIMTYRLLIKFNFSNIFMVDYCDPVTLSDNKPEVCLIQACKGPNNCFKRFCWTLSYLTSIILFLIFLHLKDSGGFRYQCKKWRFLD